VLSRAVKRAKGLVKEQVSYVEQTCRSRLRSAKQTAQRLHRQLRRKGEDKEAEQKKLYQKLVGTAEHMVRQATRVVAALGQQSTVEAQRLHGEIKKVLPLVTQVIGQTRSRVLEGKKVPSGEKVLSLFEPHTRAIPRHKGGALVEFGRHVMLDEVEGGIVTRYQILEHDGASTGKRSERWSITARSLSIRPTWSPGIVACIRRTPRNASSLWASSGSRSRRRASSPQNVKLWNTRAVSGAAIGGGRASRAASRV
jgi:hypothetical protein